MDYQRILIFMGLAVTGYLLMLAWQEDYGQQSTRAQVESSANRTTDALPSEPAVSTRDSSSQAVSSDTFIPKCRRCPDGSAERVET